MNVKVDGIVVLKVNFKDELFVVGFLNNLSIREKNVVYVDASKVAVNGMVFIVIVGNEVFKVLMVKMNAP